MAKRYYVGSVSREGFLELCYDDETGCHDYELQSPDLTDSRDTFVLASDYDALLTAMRSRCWRAGECFPPNCSNCGDEYHGCPCERLSRAKAAFASDAKARATEMRKRLREDSCNDSANYNDLDELLTMLGHPPSHGD